MTTQKQTSVSGQASKKRPFDPPVPGDMQRFVNLTDDEVSALISRTMRLLHAQGEYDQGDVAALDWDEAMDLATVAALLWDPPTGGAS